MTGSALGWATAMGVVLVMVVMVAAGSIRVDMSTQLRINLVINNDQTSNVFIEKYGYLFFFNDFVSIMIIQLVALVNMWRCFTKINI